MKRIIFQYFTIYKKNDDADCDIQDLYNWKEVNHDLKGDSNRNVKLEFENIVLSKLKRKYRKRTFWENVGIK